MISLKVPQFGFDEQKDIFYDSLINDVRKLKKKKIVIVVGDFIGYSESNTKTTWTSIEVMVMKLGIRERKEFWSFVQL